MHDRIRTKICRWCFLVLCVTPTLLTAAFIAVHWLTLHSPATIAEWESELTLRLGVAVRIEGISYPSPAVAELSGVTLADLETGIALASCRHAQVCRTAGGWQVTLVQPALEQSAAAKLARGLSQRWTTSAIHEAPIHLTARELTIQGNGAAHSLVDVAIEFRCDAAGPTIELQGKLPGDDTALEIHVVRNRQIIPPATEIRWNCPTSVPAELASAFVPQAAVLGPDATFSGTGRLVVQTDRWSGEIAGTAEGIDLSRLVNERFPHVFTGRASLALEHATIDAGQLSGARGTLLVADGGRISRSLLVAARDHLNLSAKLPSADADSIHYRRLSLRFEFHGEQLRLTAAEDSTEPGLVIADSTDPLLTASDDHQVPAVCLARTLLPDSQWQVPSARQTAAFLRLLPSPVAQPPRTARGNPRTPTRLGPASPTNNRGPSIREPSLH